MEKLHGQNWVLKTSGYLRRSPYFPTIMKRSGVSTEFIQKVLGHTNIKAAEIYGDSFEKEVEKELAGKLVAFKVEVS